MSVNRYNSTTGELERISGGLLYADAPIGSIQAYGGTTAPSGWLLCQGQAVSRTEYAELFKAIGTAFGVGDGSTTFNVPDLREAVPVGSDENDTATIAEHDTYTVGEFKDDQLQNITGELIGAAYPSHAGWGNDWTGAFKRNNIFWLGSNSNNGKSVVMYNADFDASRVARAGTTTHGKQLGVNYIIKAKQVAVPFDVAEYVRNQNELSEYESITLPISSVPYDGSLTVSVSNGGYVSFSVNARNFTIGSATGTSDTSEITLKKGDNVGFLKAGGTYVIYVRYYKLRDYTGR